MKLLRWALFLVFLLLLGLGLWWFVPVQPRCTIRHDGWVGPISEDGRRLYLLGSNPDRVEIWDTVAGRLRKTIPTPNFQDGEMEVSPGEGYIAGKDNNQNAVLIGVNTGRNIELTPIRGLPCSISFSADESDVAVQQPGELCFFHCADGKVTGSYKHRHDNEEIFPYEAFIGCFSRRYQLFLMRYIDEKGSVISGFKAGESKPLYTVNYSTWPLGETVILSKDGRHFAAAGSTQEFIGVWDTRTGKLLQQMPLCNGYGVFAMSPDGNWLLVGNDENRIQIWNIPKGEMCYDSDKAKSAVFSPKSEFVFLWNEKGYHAVFDVRKKCLLWERKKSTGGTIIGGLATNSQSFWLADWGSADFRMSLMEAVSGNTLAQQDYSHVFAFRTNDNDHRPLPFFVFGTKQVVSKTGAWWAFWERLIPNVKSRRIHIIDSNTGQRYQSLAFLSEPELKRSKDGRTLATIETTGNGPASLIKIWNLPPQTPWQWIIGIPALVGVAGCGVSFLWRRWKKRGAQ